MNRKSFLKKLSTGVTIIALAPKVLSEIPDNKYIVGSDPPPSEGDISEMWMIDVSQIPDNMTIEDVIFEWKRTGISPYSFKKLPKPNPNPMTLQQNPETILHPERPTNLK